MNPRRPRKLGWRFRALSLGALVIAFADNCRASDRRLFDDGWAFSLGEIPGAHAASFDAHTWRALDLPHDWSIESAPDRTAPGGGAIGFFPTGLGWYRKSFRAPVSWRDEQKRVAIEFEGVAGITELWINGKSLGTHPYAFTPFRYDLTSHLRFDAENVIAVRVDNSLQPAARWYTGSGIYRHVWLDIATPVHVEPGSLFVSTNEIGKASATVRLNAAVRNVGIVAADAVLETTVLDPAARKIASARTHSDVAAGALWDSSQSFEIAKPRLWTPETPFLYRAVVRVLVGGVAVDVTTTSFGLRTVYASAGRGFELNGRSIELVGGAVHHDHGVLGAASFDRAEERRVELLKAAGFNAVRTSHNPPAPAFLDACDRLGLLVIDEAFDGWAAAKTPHDYHTFFAEWWQRDLDAMVLRDRNHPSVVMWSIGNEMYERTKPSGTQLAHELATRVRKLDPTRPVTAAVNGAGRGGEWSQLDPVFAELDVAGYNYELHRHSDDHARLPQRVIYAAESYQNDAFAAWEAAHDFPYVIGDFTWSAWDYLGEAGIGRVFAPGEKVRRHWEGDHFPWHGAYCGDIDITGWRKPISHYREIVWDRGAKLYAAVVAPTPNGEPWQLTPWSVIPSLPGWTWPGAEGRPLALDIYSRHEAVRLRLNGENLRTEPTTRSQEFHARLSVTYIPGVLEIQGIDGGRVTETFALKTAGPAARVRLSVDHTRLRADGEDLAFVTVEIIDAQGEVVTPSSAPVEISISGPALLSGFGNGDMTSLESYQANPHHVFQGRALAVIRTTRKAGRIKITASSPGLDSSSVTLASNVFHEN